MNRLTHLRFAEDQNTKFGFYPQVKYTYIPPLKEISVLRPFPFLSDTINHHNHYYKRFKRVLAEEFQRVNEYLISI